jgi:hypothetical protein
MRTTGCFPVSQPPVPYPAVEPACAPPLASGGGPRRSPVPGRWRAGFAAALLSVGMTVAAADADPGATAVASTGVDDDEAHDGCAAGADAGAELPTPQALEAQGARIGRIDIDVDNVFDNSLPEESAALYRAANRLHLRTREDTVRSQLLFHEQEPYQRRKLDETERLLRGRRYLYDAWITPTCYDPQTRVVDLRVRVRDVWSLNPGFAFGRKGGVNHGGAEIEDENFLGRGELLSLGYGKNVDRSSLALVYEDPQVFDSWWQGRVEIADNSDGSLQSFDLAYPFFSLDSHWGAGFSATNADSVESRYQRGEVYDKYAVATDRFEIYGGFSHGLEDGWARRWLTGIRYENSRFSAAPDDPLVAPLPQDRRLLYPWIGLEWVQDDYTTAHNQDQLERTEDLHFGRQVRAEVGLASESLGSDRSAAMLSLLASTGLRLDDARTMFLSGGFDGRWEPAGLRDGLLRAEARYYHRQDSNSLFFASARGAAAFSPDLDHQLELGGDNGLRGYPLRYQAGEQSLLLTAEERFYTDWYPFRLFRVGAAAFVDAGRTWGDDVTGATSDGWLADAGFGLRLGNARSGLGNVFHLDIAFPLVRQAGVDSVQLVLETRQSF